MNESGKEARGLKLVGAGAGSGKTHLLTGIVTRAIDPEQGQRLPLEGLVAVTYTRKAATELAARIRQTLIRSGAYAAAQELPLASLGTVHAVCLRWLRDLALDAGLSPLLEVLPGDETSTLRRALDERLPHELRQRLERLAGQLSIGLDHRVKRWDWLEPVFNVMTLARSNRISPAALSGMAERSSRRLRELMGSPEPDSAALDQELARAIANALAALATLDTGQKNTKKARLALQAAQRELETDALPWSKWVALQKTDAGRAARAAIAPLAGVASRVDRHPRLHAQIHEFIVAVYEAASVGLTAYATWKRDRRLVDFVDMVDHALTLVTLPAVRDDFARRLELLIVDEFQDTSPAQLALFVKLHQLAGRSVWVGDPKQCIFEYAGADPALMDAVAAWVNTAGGETNVLLENRRSRPELVDACSRLFAAALERHGYRAEDVVMQPVRSVPAELATLPPFGVWSLHGTTKELAAEAIAAGVLDLLRSPHETLVEDRSTKAARSVRPGDVAVLVATNAEAEQITVALARRGVRCAVARAGLLDTPEGTLVRAALSHINDPRDAGSLAIVEALTGFSGQSPDAWLEARIAEHRRFLHARDSGEPFLPHPPSECARRLQELRSILRALTPSEALDRVLSELDVSSLCARWPDPEQRSSNIDALRAMANSYETGCRQRREAASVSGLLRFFGQSQQKVLRQEEERATDDQHATSGEQCVTVTTYHKAKGLEWPIVVLGSLDRGERRTAFSVLPDSAGGKFDPTDPLGGRWIRYWPWPYASHSNAALADAVRASPEGCIVHERESRERARLLYVGFTRARDHLILAVRPGKQRPKLAWLDELCDPAGVPLLEFPKAGSDTLSIRGSDGSVTEFPARTRAFDAGARDIGLARPVSTRWFARPEPRPALRSRYGIAPSRASADWPELDVGDVGQVVTTGQRLPLGSERPSDWSRVGDALHAFLAADLPELSMHQRLERARRLLTSFDLESLLDPTALLRSGDQLRAWIDATWPKAVWHRELPIAGVITTDGGQRRIDGSIDLLLETAGGVVIIDHKSYPGRRDTWPGRAREYAPQLAAYAEVLRMAGQIVASQWISFAVTGGAVRVNVSQPSFRVASADTAKW